MSIVLDGTNGITTLDGDVYAEGNILGTVSQTGGVPTGAIIERGSNANGDYVRYADGTQICWRSGDTGGAAAVTRTFPAAFVNTDVTASPTIRGSTTGSSLLAKSGIPTATTCEFVTVSGTTITALSFNWSAIGRWF
jgi:hypothetical protein